MSGLGLVTAGQRVLGDVAEHDSLGAALQRACGQAMTVNAAKDHDLRLSHLHHERDTAGLEPVTRGVWVQGSDVLLASAGGSGFAQRWRAHPPSSAYGHPRIDVASAWSPTRRERVAARALPQRHRALRSQVLLHHPALWAAAALGGLSPLHVSVLEVDGVNVLLAGPGGVGKSSLVADALAHGARAACDNLGASDGHLVHGVVEPLRLPSGTALGGGGARAAHDRREHRWSGRVPALQPQLVVVVRREDHGATRLRQLRGERATRTLVAGTYAAGELQRFWPLVAQLALAGLGPAHPPVREVAAQLTSSLPCFELTLGTRGTELDVVGRPTLGRLHRLLAQDIAPLTGQEISS